MTDSIKRLIKYGRKYIDYRMGMYGAIVMATIVFSINLSSIIPNLHSS